MADVEPFGPHGSMVPNEFGRSDGASRSEVNSERYAPVCMQADRADAVRRDERRAACCLPGQSNGRDTQKEA
ncbi:hypothetical protein PI86_02760 [Burkholderia sp. A9]|nr:hypothetical protein PI86_02760 [Burkholderia sp. A9]